MSIKFSQGSCLPFKFTDVAGENVVSTSGIYTDDLDGSNAILRTSGEYEEIAMKPLIFGDNVESPNISTMGQYEQVIMESPIFEDNVESPIIFTTGEYSAISVQSSTNEDAAQPSLVSTSGSYSL